MLSQGIKGSRYIFRFVLVDARQRMEDKEKVTSKKGGSRGKSPCH
jgi:hypothetical protein